MNAAKHTKSMGGFTVPKGKKKLSEPPAQEPVTARNESIGGEVNDEPPFFEEAVGATPGAVLSPAEELTRDIVPQEQDAPAWDTGLPEQETGAPGYIPPPTPKKSPVNRRKRRKRIRLIVGLSVTALVIAGIVFGMWSLFGMKKPVEYSHEPISRGMLETSVQGWGYMRPTESMEIGVASKARVLESYFFEGDTVQEGDLLFTMDSEELDKEIKEIQDKIDKAREDLAAIQGDEAERLDNLTVTAPFKGKLIDAASLKVGDRVTVGTPVGTLIDDVNLKLSLYFSYAYENDISVGMSASVSIPATMSAVGGKVEKINKVRRVSSEGTQLFEVIIALTNPGALAPDMEASAVLTAHGEEIFPYDGGKLECGRQEELTIRAPGKLSYVDIIDYMDYSAGKTLCRIEYKEDNTDVEALLQTIKGYEDELALKQKGYENLNVTAPMSGTVMYNNLVVGEVVEPGLAVISIAKLEKMIVDAQIDDRDVGKVKPGMPVEITVWLSEGQQILPGVVKTVSMSASIDQGNGTSYFPATFEIDNYSGALMSGGYADYRLVVEQKFDILVAPVIAVKSTEMGTCVFLMSDTRPDNAIDMEEGIVPPGFYAVPVECGIGNENGIEIISGVEEGAEVFTQITPLDENQEDMYGGGRVYYG